MINISNRRYIGNKSKLLEDIYESVIENKFTNKNSFFDIFSGTGVVAEFFAEKGFKTYANDLLYSNTVCHKAWLEDGKYDKEKLKKKIVEYNELDYDDIEENYFSDIYGDKYFTINDAKKIGLIREDIELNRNNLSEKEYNILLASLIYATDRAANTVGHFEHFLKKDFLKDCLNLKMLNIKETAKTKVYTEDANVLASKVKADIVYIDPPYNARQYVNFYHVLENLARWEKPTEFEGISMKFKRNHLKSGYSQSIAPELMKDLIKKLDAKIIIVSYNNTYTAKSSASNNKITEEEMLDILKSKGTVYCKEIEHKFFNAGKTNFKKHIEKLYICKVGEK